jgi:DNA mismatch repair protein MutS
MDEIGRGTSTFDGLSLAWAARHGWPAATRLHPVRHALFRAHRRCPNSRRSAANVHLDATEYADRIVFLHAVRPGPASRSYGLQVAALAGVPQSVIAEARLKLAALESSGGARAALTEPGAAKPQAQLTLDLDSRGDELITRLRNLDTDALSPREALALLYELHEQARGIY